MANNLWLTVRTRSGVALTHDRGPGDTNHSLQYIPGSAVRGAMAARYLAQDGAATDDFFRQAFIEEGVTFPDLYPIQRDDNAGTSYVVPLTALGCKYWPGFQGLEQGQRQEMHGVQDTLIRMAEYQMGQNVNRLLDLNTCLRQGCEQSLDRFSGFAEHDSGGKFHKREVQTRFMARVGIDRQRRSAAEGLLYTIEAIAEDQWFRGEIRCQNKALQEKLQNLCGSKGKFRVGVGRTRGLGALDYTIKDAKDTFGNLRERLRELNKACGKLKSNLKNPIYFTITLVSDCILPDPFLRYCRTFTPAMIATELGLVSDRLQLLSHAVDHCAVRGWNAALGLPKSEQIAIVKGSTFLFCYEGSRSLNKEIKDQRAALQGLEDRGIGLRRGEGFGRLIVAHPFHYDAADRAI